MNFAERRTEDRRLVILRLLENTPGYEAGESMLHIALMDFGHEVSRDQVRSDLAWLEEQGLVRSNQIASVMIARATQRGIDVAQGRATAPGVKRPAHTLRSLSKPSASSQRVRACLGTVNLDS
jgi:hypothetical protein